MQEFNFRDYGNYKIPLEESLTDGESVFISRANDNEIFKAGKIAHFNNERVLPILILFEPEKPSQEE